MCEGNLDDDFDVQDEPDYKRNTLDEPLLKDVAGDFGNNIYKSLISIGETYMQIRGDIYTLEIALFKWYEDQCKKYYLKTIDNGEYEAVFTIDDGIENRKTWPILVTECGNKRYRYSIANDVREILALERYLEKRGKILPENRYFYRIIEAKIRWYESLNSNKLCGTIYPLIHAYNKDKIRLKQLFKDDVLEKLGQKIRGGNYKNDNRYGYEIVHKGMRLLIELDLSSLCTEYEIVWHKEGVFYGPNIRFSLPNSEAEFIGHLDGILQIKKLVQKIKNIPGFIYGNQLLSFE